MEHRDENGPDIAATEAAAHAMLRVVADMPGQMGRLRVARVVGGYTVRAADEELVERLSRYAVEHPGGLREIVELVDALIAGQLLAQTVGQRPTLVLTRAGYRALEALESTSGGGASDPLPRIQVCP